MADSLRGSRSMEQFASLSPGSLDGTLPAPPSKSRRTLRQSKSMVIGERKAYPLPDPRQFEDSAPPPPDPANDILYPMQSLRKEREKSREMDAPSALPLKQPAPSPGDTDKQPFVETSTEIKTEAAQPTHAVVVVVYDAEHKFTTAPVDVALNGYARAAGDVVVVLAFLEHIMSPMGMKMVADLSQFSGVNQLILTQTALAKKAEIEAKLAETSRLQVCQMKKIQLHVKVVPGSNPKAVVANAVLDSQATCVIFDKNAMKSRKYYEETLACQILRVRGDGRRVETVSLFGQATPASSHCSDSSSDSSMSSELASAPSVWSRLRMFGSKRSARLSHGSSRTSSNLGSPRPPPVEDDDDLPVLDNSFSFDSPKPSPVEAFAYAAAGLEKFGPCARGNGDAIKPPAALAA